MSRLTPKDGGASRSDFLLSGAAVVASAALPTTTVAADAQAATSADTRVQGTRSTSTVTTKYTGAPHGMFTTLKDKVNADLLAFFQGVS